MDMQILVDADGFWPVLQSDIRSAKERVYIQTLSFEGDSAGKRLAVEMKSCEARDKRIIADDFYTKHRINDLYLHNPKHWFNTDIRRERDATLEMMQDLESNGVRVRLSNPSGPFVLKGFARDHKKIIVIDKSIAYLGGINFSEHNFAWHDMMLRIEDPAVADFLANDFLATWAGKHLNSSNKFGPVEIYRFDGKINHKTFEPILDLIGNAKRSVYVASPYITYPFYERMRQARQNGAEVVLISPEENNWTVMKEYSLWDSARSGVEVRMYPGRMSHLKAMLIDDTYLVVGSSNFDFLSQQFLQEIVAVITDETVVAQFKEKILDKDLKESTPATQRVNNLRGYYHKTCLMILSEILRTIGSVVTYGR